MRWLFWILVGFSRIHSQTIYFPKLVSFHSTYNLQIHRRSHYFLLQWKLLTVHRMLHLHFVYVLLLNGTNDIVQVYVIHHLAVRNHRAPGAWVPQFCGKYSFHQFPESPLMDWAFSAMSALESIKLRVKSSHYILCSYLVFLNWMTCPWLCLLWSFTSPVSCFSEQLHCMGKMSFR